MPMSADEITQLVKNALPDAVIELTDLAGDNDHWQIAVTSSEFKGKSRIDQHRMVSGALKGRDLHALSITTKVA